jgi:hypothetical protein
MGWGGWGCILAVMRSKMAGAHRLALCKENSPPPILQPPLFIVGVLIWSPEALSQPPHRPSIFPFEVPLPLCCLDLKKSKVLNAAIFHWRLAVCTGVGLSPAGKGRGTKTVRSAASPLEPKTQGPAPLTRRWWCARPMHRPGTKVRQQERLASRRNTDCIRSAKQCGPVQSHLRPRRDWLHGKTWLFASYMTDDERFQGWDLFHTRNVYPNQFRPAVVKMDPLWKLLQQFVDERTGKPFSSAIRRRTSKSGQSSTASKSFILRP